MKNDKKGVGAFSFFLLLIFAIVTIASLSIAPKSMKPVLVGLLTAQIVALIGLTIYFIVRSNHDEQD